MNTFVYFYFILIKYLILLNKVLENPKKIPGVLTISSVRPIEPIRIQLIGNKNLIGILVKKTGLIILLKIK